ncbi:hypothetical protein HMPREF2909_00840 [Alloscardovia sp. HMSC034E08]|nr:hypothetical protein HMPREF2909_00840 [Alloscardovia sp. HMSC034E08]
MVKEVQLTDRYHLRNKDVLARVNSLLAKKGIELLDQNGEIREFNTYHFGLICKVYNIKNQSKYAWDKSVANEEKKSYLYSESVVDFVYEIISKNPDTIVKSLRDKTKINETYPRSKGILNLVVLLPFGNPALIRASDLVSLN